MARENSGNLKAFSRSTYFFREGRFGAVYPWPEEALISYVEPDIKLSKLLPSEDNVVAFKIKNKHRDILLSTTVDFEV